MSEQDNYNDDWVINYTQGLRHGFVEQRTNEGWPEDSKEQRVILTALKDMDQTALANKRMEKDTAIAEDQRRTSEMLSNIYRRIGNTNPFESEEGTGGSVEVPGSFDPDAEFVEGEDEIGTSLETHDEFMTRMNDDED